MSSRRKDVATYLVGYVMALVLTGAAFALVRWPQLRAATTFATVLGLGLVQMVVHFRFFLHIDFKRASRHDLQLILFSALIILLMALGTLVILANLRHRMM